MVLGKDKYKLFGEVELSLQHYYFKSRQCATGNGRRKKAVIYYGFGEAADYSGILG